ncbi:MAG: cytochrome b [Geminicoccaceae bacterium]
MALTNSREVWGGVAIALHWLMALMIIGMLVAGTIMVDWPDDDLETKFRLYQLHKSFGITLLALTILRLAWRLLQPVPPLPESAPGWMRVGAGLSHMLLYGLMLAIPVAGWLMASASPLGIPTQIFGLFTLPHLVAASEPAEALYKAIHYWLGNALILLLVVHVAAALKHHFVDRDAVLVRMLGRRERA